MHDIIHTRHHHEAHLEDEEDGHVVGSDWLTIVMEEYRTLRREIIASLAMQQSSLTLGTLALGGLAVAGLHDWADAESSLSLVVFLLVVPLISYISVFIWLGEYVRMMRAGSFLTRIENKVNRSLGVAEAAFEEKALTWEAELRTASERRPASLWERLWKERTKPRPPQFAWNSWAIFLFFVVLVPVASVVMANLSGSGVELSLAPRMALDGSELLVFLVLGAYLLPIFLHALCEAGARPTHEVRGRPMQEPLAAPRAGRAPQNGSRALS